MSIKFFTTTPTRNLAWVLLQIGCFKLGVGVLGYAGQGIVAAIKRSTEQGVLYQIRIWRVAVCVGAASDHGPDRTFCWPKSITV